MNNRPNWLKGLEKISAVTFFIAGSLMVVHPVFFLKLIGATEDAWPQIFVIVGMLKILLALTLYKVSHHLREIYGLAIIGFILTALEPIAFVYYGIGGLGTLPYLVFTDFLAYPVWLFYMYWAWYDQQDTTTDRTIPTPFDALKLLKDGNGKSIYELQQDKKVLLVFIRHSGCTFCMQTLAKLSNAYDNLIKHNIHPIVVHMEKEAEKATKLFSKYNLSHIHQIPDPECILYQSFDLERAEFRQAFGPEVIKKGVQAFIKEGHFIGPPSGDGFRMPGTFLIHKDQFLWAERPELVCEISDFGRIAKIDNAVATT
jgi:peroxiredoxin